MRKKKKNDLRLEALHTAVRRNDVKTVMSMLKKIKSEDFIDSHPNHHEYAGNGSKKEEVDCRGYCSDGGNTRTITKKNFLMEKQFKVHIGLILFEAMVEIICCICIMLETELEKFFV